MSSSLSGDTGALDGAEAAAGGPVSHEAATHALAAAAPPQGALAQPLMPRTVGGGLCDQQKGWEKIWAWCLDESVMWL